MSTYVAASILFAAGLILGALAMAFPLSLSVVEQQALAVSAADLALGERLSAFWPIFLGAGAACWAAGLAIVTRRESAS